MHGSLAFPRALQLGRHRPPSVPFFHFSFLKEKPEK